LPSAGSHVTIRQQTLFRVFNPQGDTFFAGGVSHRNPKTEAQKLRGSEAQRPTQACQGQRICVARRAECLAFAPVADATGKGCAGLRPKSQIPAGHETKLVHTKPHCNATS